LDIGCGTGIFTNMVSNIYCPSAKVVGVDNNKEVLLQANKLFEGKAKAVFVDIRNDLPFAKTHFDLILCLNVLMALDDQELKHTIKEIYRILISSPGKAVLSIVHPDWTAAKYMEKIPSGTKSQSVSVDYEKHKILHWWRPLSAYTDIFHQHGLNVLNIKEATIPESCVVSERYKNDIGKKIFAIFQLEKSESVQ
jgi:SAM-dependent methyltransferase